MQSRAVGSRVLLPIPIQEVAHAGEEQDTPVTDDPGRNVVGGRLKLCDTLHPPFSHGVDQHP
eukprot:11946301-Alexandrium_andersonii.AAC.1